MEKIGTAIIGAGIMGKNHARVYHELDQTEVIAAADLVESNAKELAALYNADSYTDYEQMLVDDRIQAVSVATPDFAHYEPVVACLQAGKHVLVEKPMTTTLDEADRILDVVRETGLKFMVNYSHRWVPSYYQAKVFIEEGKIGQPLMGYTRKNDHLYVSTEMFGWAGRTSSAMFLSAHDIDLVRWYLDSEGDEVTARAVSVVLKKRGITAPDAIQAQVKFKSGAVVTFESCWIYPNTWPSMVDSFISLTGTEGVIYLERDKEQVKLGTPEAYTYPRNLLTFPIFGKLQGAFQLSLSHFIECIVEDREPIVCGTEGRNVSAILCAIHESIEAGEAVKVRV